VINTSREELLMSWIIGGALGVGLVTGAGIWLLGPAVHAFFGPDFEPTSKDEASVFRAQSSGDSRSMGA
jgi:hypothetical protein